MPMKYYTQYTNDWNDRGSAVSSEGWYWMNETVRAPGTHRCIVLVVVVVVVVVVSLRAGAVGKRCVCIRTYDQVKAATIEYKV